MVAELDLDTNSGVISRLTWNGATWELLHLVRGLPRSEENHSTNGLQYDATEQRLYVAQGGHTNQGAPSNNFAFLPEYALSAAILSIDLDAIGNHLQPADASAPARTQPFGGNDGLNQAKLVSGGPVQVYSPGWRNPYDVLLTADGQLYTIDNGPNGGWGAVPVSEGPAARARTRSPSRAARTRTTCTTSPGPATTPGTRTRPAATSRTRSTAQPGRARGQPGRVRLQDPRSPRTVRSTPSRASTNGLTEYTASNFGGQMIGDLLTASFNGVIYRIQLTADGTASSRRRSRSSPASHPSRST